MALSISDHCRSCVVSLQEVISILSQPDLSDHHVKPSQVCEELDRFSLFIGNIGALHRPESPLSIESRLKDANDVLTHILGLLTDLNDITAELLDIVSGKREGMVAIANEAGEEGEVISEANELREEISETITRLFRVSILIRQAAPADIFAKALSRNRYHFNDQFDIAHVGEKYRKLATEDYAWLRQRLGRAITQRRHYLRYIHDHREKLKDTYDHHEKADSSAAKSQVPVTKLLLDSKPMLDAESRPSFFTKATTVAAERIIPQLHVAGDSDPDEDARSYTTVSRSIDGDDESAANVRIPKLDTLRANHKNEFECPFCYRIKKFKSERIWRKHVFSDLRPYVCTFPDCDAPYFGDINKWFHHEMTLHRVTYNCFLCQKVYHQEEKYISHLWQEHGDTLDDGGAQAGTDLARKSLAQIPASDCPCCSDWADRLEERLIQTSGSAPTGILAVTPTMFKRHLAAHLEQLALFAVPTTAATDDNKDSHAAIEEARSKRTNTSQISALTFQSLPGNLDDSSPGTEMDIVSQVHTQASEIQREDTTKRSLSLPSDLSESTDGGSIVNSLILSKRKLKLEKTTELAKTIEENRVALGDDHPDTLASMTKLAFLYGEHDRMQDAYDLLFHVMEITQRKLGDEHPDTLTSMTNLALNYNSQGRWEESNALLVQVLETTKTTRGHDHPDTLASMRRLASSYSFQGRRKEEGELLARILDINKTTLGHDHLDTLASMQDLASNYESQNLWEEVEKLFAQILENDKTKLGQRHPHTLFSMYHLGLALSHQSRWDEAKEIYRQLISVSEEMLGRNNEQTLQAKQDLAHVLEKQGELESAAALLRETLTGFDSLYGPTTLSSKERLASILRGQGRYDEGEALQREVLMGYEDKFGPGDATTLSSKEKLATILRDQEKYEEAEVLQREVLIEYEDQFGPDDERTLECVQKLAMVLARSGKLEEEELLRRRALEVSERLFECDDLRTISTMNILAGLQANLGKFDEEEVLRREVVRRYQRAVGHNNFGTIQALERLAKVLSENNKLEEAENLYREVTKLHSERFGSEDGYTLEASSDLASVLAKQGKEEKLEEAESLYRKIIRVSNKALGSEHFITTTAFHDLASILAKQGKFEEEEELRREQVMAYERQNGRDHPNTLERISNLASLLESHKKLEQAEALYREVFEMRIRTDGSSMESGQSLGIVESMHALASVQEKQEKFEAAESTYRQAKSILVDKRGQLWEPYDLEIMDRLYGVLEKQGKVKEAKKVQKQALWAEKNLLRTESDHGTV